MKIASHNSYSYLPVRRWWMKPIAFTARCQRLNITKQFMCGVRLFDIRVRFDKKGRPYLCHGLIEYDYDPHWILKSLSILGYHQRVYVRMVLETRKPDEWQEMQFRNYCELLELNYSNITFFGGNNRTDWECKHPIYDFKNPLPDIKHSYASATTRFPKGWKWLRHIDDLYPLGYARKYNKKNTKNLSAFFGEQHEWLMLDFVDIQWNAYDDVKQFKKHIYD